MKIGFENSTRFISAYNGIDKKLRAIYNLKANMTFPEVIRKSAAHSPFIRRNEEVLLSFARLRNAIVHSSQGKKVIAEPHENVVEQIEHIFGFISSPPLALSVAHKPGTVNYDATIFHTVKYMAASDFSNVPVIRDGEIIGVVSNKLLIKAISKIITTDPMQLSSRLMSDPVISVLTQEEKHYLILNEKTTVDDCFLHFDNNRKLRIIIITRSGSPYEQIEGVITVSDIMTITTIMVDFDN